MKNLATVAAAIVLSHGPAAHGAEPATARLTGVSGNVLVSFASSISSADEGQALVEGVRVLVTGNSAATIEFRDGCRIRLQPGERYEVRAAVCRDVGGRLTAGASRNEEPRS